MIVEIQSHGDFLILIKFFLFGALEEISPTY